jgi:transcriptional regulator NrdR family protein
MDNNFLDKHDLDDVNCPKCGSNNTRSYDTDDLEFGNDGTGYLIRDHECKDCGKHFRVDNKFKYELVEQHVRK